MIYTMMQICKETGLTYQALKFYCNEGLVPNVKRDGNNRRIFDDWDLKWLKDLVCLKKCGAGIREMKNYLDLCMQGESTVVQQRELFMEKRTALLNSIREMEECIAYVEEKQKFYDDVLSGKHPYLDNLVRIKE